MWEGDEFRGFDPRKHWAEVNHEFVADIIPLKEIKHIEALIKFLVEPRTYAEAKQALGLSQGTVTRYLNCIRSIRGVQLERRAVKTNLNSYRVVDGRGLKK